MHALHINLEAIIFFSSRFSLCRAISDSVTMLKELLIEKRKTRWKHDSIEKCFSYVDLLKMICNSKFSFN